MDITQILQFGSAPKRLRAIAFVEGISYLLLLLVAMPMKYLLRIKLGVTIVGGIHGALFVAFAFMTLHAMIAYKKGILWGIKVGFASIVPLGTFFLDKDLKDLAEKHG
jgi:integral membrane protein